MSKVRERCAQHSNGCQLNRFKGTTREAGPPIWPTFQLHTDAHKRKNMHIYMDYLYPTTVQRLFIIIITFVYQNVTREIKKFKFANYVLVLNKISPSYQKKNIIKYHAIIKRKQTLRGLCVVLTRLQGMLTCQTYNII